MGQQQLLLLVLGIVLVGLAVVVGISAFSENQRKAAIDNATARNATYVGMATAWRMTPRAMGGGQGAADSRALGLAQFGIAPSEVLFSTTNSVGGQAEPGKAVVMYYLASGADGPTVETWDLAHGIKVATFLYGTNPACHVFRYGFRAGAMAATWADFQSGSWTYVPANIPPAPAGCVW